jgi:hypothetical protein
MRGRLTGLDQSTEQLGRQTWEQEWLRSVEGTVQGDLARAVTLLSVGLRTRCGHVANVNVVGSSPIARF